MASGSARRQHAELVARRVRAITSPAPEHSGGTAVRAEFDDAWFEDPEPPDGHLRFGLTDTDAPAASLDGPARAPVPGLRFGRRQLLVVAVLLAAGLLIAGWAVLRARPVALAAPHVESTAAADVTPSPVGGADASADATASQTGTPGASTGRGSGGPVVALIEVHVLGAVRRPGLVRLDPGSRVADALARAGGVTTRARLGQLNLAQPMSDGQQLYVATLGGKTPSAIRDPVPPGTAGVAGGAQGSPNSSGDRSGSGTGSVTAGSSGATGKTDLNTASESDLDALPGVGPVTAGKIIAWRTAHGRFTSITELQEVDGIGPKTFADLAPHVTV